jgi:RIO kinase 1
VPRHKLWSDDDSPSRRDGYDWSPIGGPPVEFDLSDDLVPGGGDRWSTWDLSGPGERGPEPYPDWLVTQLAAVDVELGVLKTGKEADVHLVRRGVPELGPECLLAAKRYRDAKHRQFHRDAGYQEGRRARESRQRRAMAKRTGYGRTLVAAHWARAEFDALCLLRTLGAAVPYPVQIVGTEVLLEFVGDPSGAAAPRLAETGLRGDEAAAYWDQAVELLVLLARAGLAHGDLSAYNLLVDGDRLVMIDLPQVVDVVANPQGRWYLDRDAENLATWFTTHDHPVDLPALQTLLHSEARLG